MLHHKKPLKNYQKILEHQHLSSINTDDIVNGALSFLFTELYKNGIPIDLNKSDKDVALFIESIKGLIDRNRNKKHPIHVITDFVFNKDDENIHLKKMKLRK